MLNLLFYAKSAVPQYRQIKHFNIPEISVCRKFLEKLALYYLPYDEVYVTTQPIFQLVTMARTDLKNET